MIDIHDFFKRTFPDALIANPSVASLHPMKLRLTIHGEREGEWIVDTTGVPTCYVDAAEHCENSIKMSYSAFQSFIKDPIGLAASYASEGLIKVNGRLNLLPHFSKLFKVVKA
ncbi:hypothetical protein [Cellulophaga sp. BC115SP]|uniref:hypothetical protein n=1 Tax=Cellulophaga sp. BC115SP TaxID=2683263 RepID=UPI001412BFED|nr:hypothetical protein [Cellulophaga sp. BC115SP]NBB30699.1 hypothetical protein [Cellulophaga sp. BC115SP]